MRRSWIWFAAAAAAGCSSGTGPSDGGADAGISAQQACADYATALCTLRDGCTGGFDITVAFGDDSTCVSRVQTDCSGSVAATGSGATPAHFEACAQALAGTSCPAFFANQLPQACQPPAGKLAAGAGCAFSAQCESSYCAVGANEVCGSCQPAPAAGSSCDGGLACGPGLLCLADTGACAVAVADGGACASRDACGPSEACVATPTGSAYCEPRGGIGTACDPTDQTAPNCFNAGGAYCSRTARDAGGTCVAISVQQPGEPCGATLAQDQLCGNGGLCVRGADGGGSCVGFVSDGQSCDSVAGPPCLQPAKCVPVLDGGTAGTCMLPGMATCP